MRRLILIAFVVSLAGCAPSNLRELEAAGNVFVFHVERNYQAVYKDVLTQSKQCYEYFLGVGEGEIEGELFDELGEAQVQLWAHTALAPSIFAWNMQIRKSGEDGAQSIITVHAMNEGAWKRVSEAVTAWASGEKHGC